MCNLFCCHYVFKKPSAAEASESVYMRERVKLCRNVYCRRPWKTFAPFPHCVLKKDDVAHQVNGYVAEMCMKAQQLILLIPMEMMMTKIVSINKYNKISMESPLNFTS